MSAWRGALVILALASLSGCGAEEEGVGSGSFQAEVRIATVQDTEIAYYERGEGPPLLMLIGTGSTMAEWDPALLRVLARDQRLIMLDYPGVGFSGAWSGDSFSDLAGTVASFMEAIGLERAGVLGWSMGGFVAQRLAIEHPELVSSLILAGTNPGGRRSVLGTPRAQRIDSDPDPSERQILSLLYPPGERVEGRLFVDRLVRAARSGEIPDDFGVPARTTEAQVAAEDPWLRSERNWRQLDSIGVPTLAAAGRSDPVTPEPNMRRIAGRIPTAELLVLPGAHAFLFQERDEFAAAVGRLPG